MLPASLLSVMFKVSGAPSPRPARHMLFGTLALLGGFLVIGLDYLAERPGRGRMPGVGVGGDWGMVVTERLASRMEEGSRGAARGAVVIGGRASSLHSPSG